MVKFINKFTGSIMWVADEREQEYKDAGHKPASESVAQKPIKDPIVKKSKKK